MTEVLKDSFETRMKIREFEAKIKNLAKRVNEIEKKQAERYPNLIGRIGRMENSFPALVERLDRIENDLSELKEDTHTHTVYGGTAVPVTKDNAEGGSW